MNLKPTKDERLEFGQRLKAARTHKGWTQGQLATACGVSSAMVVSKWENGVNVPGDRVPWILCQVFGYDTWARLWGDEAVSPLVITSGSERVTMDDPLVRLESARVLRAIADGLEGT